MRTLYTICLLSLFLFSCKKEETPKEKPTLSIPLKEVNISITTDSIEGGNSTASFINNLEGHLAFVGQTGSTQNYPYPYWNISFSPQGSDWDISSFDSVKISFIDDDIYSCESIFFTLSYEIEGFTDTTQSLTYAPYQFRLPGKSPNVTIPLKQFVIPRWWYDANNVKKENIDTAVKSFKYFSFSNDYLSSKTQNSVRIKSIIFK